MSPRHAALIFACLSTFLMPAFADAAGLSRQVADRVDRMMNRTFLFRNDTDKIPQLEYLLPGGRGFVWSAALEDKVVPVRWTIENGSDGNGRFCMLFKAKDIGTPSDLRLCDGLDEIADGLRDSLDGDVYGLSRSTHMAAPLPSNISGFDELDQLLGRN